MKQSPLNVLIVHEAINPDARADELDTLIQAEQVADALRQLGCSVSILQAGLDLAAVLGGIEKQQPHCVFNLVESLGGDGRMVHFVPALLRTAGVPFTGSDDDAIYLSSQKQLAKNWMRSKGIPTPSSFNLEGESSPPDTRWIVKSVWEHASFGMDDGCVVNGIEATQARIGECMARYGGEWFAEQFIEGREFNISVLEEAGKPLILPIAEIGFKDFPPGKPKIVGYAAKWDEQAPEYIATPRSFPNLDERLSDALNWVVNKCWKSFGLNGYARVDIRVDSKGIPWVLEVNANPCLSRDAGFAVAAQRAGIGYEQLIDKILYAGIRTDSFTGSAPAAHGAYISASGKA